MRRKYLGHEGNTSINASLFDVDMVIEFDYKITCDAIPSSHDEPASGMEYEVSFTGLYEDDLKKRFSLKEYLDTPKWLVDILQEYLENCEDVYYAIEQDME